MRGSHEDEVFLAASRSAVIFTLDSFTVYSIVSLMFVMASISGWCLETVPSLQETERIRTLISSCLRPNATNKDPLQRVLSEPIYTLRAHVLDYTFVTASFRWKWWSDWSAFVGVTFAHPSCRLAAGVLWCSLMVAGATPVARRRFALYLGSLTRVVVEGHLKDVWTVQLYH